jgi:hypothetical protein
MDPRCEIAPELYVCISDGLQANKWAQDIQGVIDVHEIAQYLTILRLTEQKVHMANIQPNRLTLPLSMDQCTARRGK